jgi:hypothetical protein
MFEGLTPLMTTMNPLFIECAKPYPLSRVPAKWYSALHAINGPTIVTPYPATSVLAVTATLMTTLTILRL